MSKKIAVLDAQGKKTKEIDAPSFFFQPVREDMISKMVELKKRVQPYSPSLVAGKQSTAQGKIVHRRHVWRSGYGRGQSRIPRKIMSRSGSQFGWVGAEVANTRGGRRAHPPKVSARMGSNGKINKREAKLALISALSATAEKSKVAGKYGRLDVKDIKELPMVIDSKFVTLKTKEFINAVESVLGERLFSVALKKKAVRSGRGKRRGRKYKENAGVLFVLGKKEKMKTNIAETRNADTLGILDLASGGSGRITIYTEDAVKELASKLEKK